MISLLLHGAVGAVFILSLKPAPPAETPPIQIELVPTLPLAHREPAAPTMQKPSKPSPSTPAPRASTLVASSKASSPTAPLNSAPALIPALATQTALSSALRSGQACAALRAAGKPLPAACGSTTLASVAPLGPRPNAAPAAAAARINQHIAFQESPGSPDFWAQGKALTPNDRHFDDIPKYGLYDGNPHNQRVFGACSLAASCTSDGSDPRRPGDPHP